MPRTSRPRFAAAAALIAASAALAPLLGCGESTPVPLVPARGRVTFKGEPLAGALVVFKPTEPPVAGVPMPSGTTDADGRYVLHTFAGDDGAPVGAYKASVRVVPPSKENRSFLQKVERASRKSGAATPNPRYADPESSGLAAEVKAGGGDLPDLTLD